MRNLVGCRNSVILARFLINRVVAYRHTRTPVGIVSFAKVMAHRGGCLGIRNVDYCSHCVGRW